MISVAEHYSAEIAIRSDVRFRDTNRLHRGVEESGGVNHGPATEDLAPRDAAVAGRGSAHLHPWRPAARLARTRERRHSARGARRPARRTNARAGIYERSAILRQDHEALRIIEEVAPDRIVTFGGDCSVSLAPFSYLASRYAGDVAILWIDSHTDFAGPDSYPYAHGYPVNNLLGHGDPEFVAFVKDPLPAGRLAYVGLQKRVYADLPLFTELGVTAFDPAELTPDFNGDHDLDQEDRRIEAPGPLRPRRPGSRPIPRPTRRASGRARRALSRVALRSDQSRAGDGAGVASGEAADIVALSITEHLPWDAEICGRPWPASRSLANARRHTAPVSGITARANGQRICADLQTPSPDLVR